jgi:hypothetical protein
MATEKAALDLSTCAMEACRTALDRSVIELTEALEATPKTTCRRRIKGKAKDIDLSFLEDTIEL